MTTRNRISLIYYFSASNWKKPKNKKNKKIPDLFIFLLYSPCPPSLIELSPESTYCFTCPPAIAIAIAIFLSLTIYPFQCSFSIGSLSLPFIEFLIRVAINPTSFSHFSIWVSLRSQFFALGVLNPSKVLIFLLFYTLLMSHNYAIELYFDPALENQVLKAWNVLARRQISTQLIEIESRPHITLYATSFVDLGKLESVIKNFASKQEPLALSLSSVGCLPADNNVLFLAPTPTLSLLQFHSQLCDAMKREGIEINEEYRPDSWVPYCSVAQEVPKARMEEAFSVLRDLKLPVSGCAMDIGLVESSPVRELFSSVLGNIVE